MKNTSMIKASLLGSSSALGLNWIYDRTLLENFSKNNNVLFIRIDDELYSKAKTSFNVYPDAQVGDLDFMGETLFAFHDFLESDLPKDGYSFRLHFNKLLNPRNGYTGYVEHYGVDLFDKVDNNTEFDSTAKTSYIDKQLIGPAFLLAIFERDDIKNKVQTALKYSQVLTAYDGTINFLNLLFNLFTNLKNNNNKIDSLLESITYAPKDIRKSLSKSLEDLDINEFIDKYSGVACGIEQSFPLIFYITAHCDTYEEALTLNAILGGASSARGLFISALFNIIEGTPEKYSKMLNYKIK